MRRFTDRSRWSSPSPRHASSPFASASPDGLEKVAERPRRSPTTAARPAADAPAADYAFPGIHDARLATAARRLRRHARRVRARRRLVAVVRRRPHVA